MAIHITISPNRIARGDDNNGGLWRLCIVRMYPVIHPRGSLNVFMIVSIYTLHLNITVIATFRFIFLFWPKTKLFYHGSLRELAMEKPCVRAPLHEMTPFAWIPPVRRWEAREKNEDHISLFCLLILFAVLLWVNTMFCQPRVRSLHKITIYKIKKTRCKQTN